MSAQLLNNAGEMIERICIETFSNFENAAIDKYIVMPNNFHGIIVINASPRARLSENRIKSGIVDINHNMK